MRPSVNGHRLAGMAPGVDFLQIVDGNMGVDLGRFQGFMTEKLLDMADRGTVLHHVGGTGMAEGMGEDVLSYSRLLHTALDYGPDAGHVHLVAPTVEDERTSILSLHKGGTNREQITPDQVANPG